MKMKLFLLSLLVCGYSLTATAAVKSGDLPDGTVWYMHADLSQMRSSESGAPIYDWFDDEILVEINDELDINIGDEVDSITAFSDQSSGTVIVINGRFSKSLRDDLLNEVEDEVRLRDFSHEGKTYYHASGDDDDDGDDDNDDDDDRRHRHDDSDPFGDFDDALYFSFGVDKKLIVTSHEEPMKALLDSDGEITGSGSVEGAMFVLTADKSFVQAGLRPDAMTDDDDDGWESNIIRNTEQAALLISDSDGQIAIEARLVSTDPKMAQSIGGIVNGLISLQAFNSDLDPEIQMLIQNTSVTVTDNLLSISTVVDPSLIIDIIVD